MKRILPLLFFLAFFTGIALPGSAQIVNTENAKMDMDTTGWRGSLNASLGLSKYVARVFTTHAGVHIQYKKKKHLWILLGHANFLKVGSSKYADARFLHLRYGVKLRRRFHWEFFGQVEDNQIIKLRSRVVFGTGPRMKLFSNKFIHMHIATHFTYEQENEKTEPTTERSDFRSSSYVSFTITPAERVEINSTTFYQPLFTDLADSRILNQVKLKVSANKHFGMTLQWNYFHDRFPVKSVPQTQYSFNAGLNYDF